mgnify:CR=1 FL=1
MADEVKPPTKPGYKTSEFAVTVATTLGGLAMASGLLHSNDAANVKTATDAISAAGGAGGGWMGLALALVSQAMYVWSRTRSKQ